jgi:ABC-type taurine transport system ATPase subunit
MIRRIKMKTKLRVIAILALALVSAGCSAGANTAATNSVPARSGSSDEISTMLDVITQSQIWNIVLDYAKKHQIGILAITHNEHLAKAICTRIVHLQ